MVNQKLVVISYCCIFLFILFCAVGYIIIPTYLNKAFHKSIDLPKTAVMDNAASAMSAIPTSNLFWLMLLVIIGVAALFLYGSFSMFGAY
jgi:hypothetical protein